MGQLLNSILYDTQRGDENGMLAECCGVLSHLMNFELFSNKSRRLSRFLQKIRHAKRGAYQHAVDNLIGVFNKVLSTPANACLVGAINLSLENARYTNRLGR